MKFLFPIILIAICVLTTGVIAQDHLNQSAPPACPSGASELPVAALYGQWEARFDGVAGIATVQLGPHPDYAGSVRGTLTRPDGVAQLAGDIDDDGVLTLDESQDGRAISATWSGDMQAGSCGKEFKGLWRNSQDSSTREFVLQRADGWQ